MDIKIAKKMIGGIEYSQGRNRVNNRPVKEILITAEDLVKKYNDQNGKCYWSGLVLDVKFNAIKHHPFAISPERLDNSKAYTYDNVVLTRRIFNLGRMAFPENDFRVVVEDLKSEIKSLNMDND